MKQKDTVWLLCSVLDEKRLVLGTLNVMQKSVLRS